MSQDTANTEGALLSASLVDLTAGIVSAYVTNQHVPISDMPTLISSVHSAVVAANSGTAPTVEVATEDLKKTPAEIKKSIKKEGLISFIDGKSYKTLKRHLTTNGLDEAGYKARYGLPVDYPMVCSEYSEQRSTLAKKMGLGRGGAATTQEAA